MTALVSLLQMALKGEYQQWDMYSHYKDVLRGSDRTAISEEFVLHAQEELAHIDTLQRYLVGFGVVPTIERDMIPLSSSYKKDDILRLQIEFEKKAVKTYQQILLVLKETSPLRIELENILAKEKEHVQDLELLLENN